MVDGAFAGGSVEAAVPRRMIEGPSGLKRTRAALEGHFNKIMAAGAEEVDGDLQQSELMASQRLTMFRLSIGQIHFFSRGKPHSY